MAALTASMCSLRFSWEVYTATSSQASCRTFDMPSDDFIHHPLLAPPPPELPPPKDELLEELLEKPPELDEVFFGMRRSSVRVYPQEGF